MDDAAVAVVGEGLLLVRPAAYAAVPRTAVETTGNVAVKERLAPPTAGRVPARPLLVVVLAALVRQLQAEDVANVWGQGVA